MINRILTIAFPCMMFILLSCSETQTNNAEESYYQWSGKKVSDDIKIVHGQYSQTRGFIKEYTLFLEMKPSLSWRNEFLKENELNSDDETWSIPEKAPTWFNPGNSCIRWKSAQPFAESLYLQDTISGSMFIYEVE